MISNTIVVFRCQTGKQKNLNVELDTDGQYNITFFRYAEGQAGLYKVSRECAGQPGYKNGCPSFEKCEIINLARDLDRRYSGVSPER